MKRIFQIASVWVLFILCTKSFSQDIIEWRGPNRAGVFNETGLLKEWPEEGPELLWSVRNLPEGHGSNIIIDSTIFRTGNKQ